MERTVLTMLKKASGRAAAQAALRASPRETEGQIQNLEQAFSSLGVKAAGHTCHAMEGLKKAPNWSRSLRRSSSTACSRGGATHVEYEIATYEGLSRRRTRWASTMWWRSSRRTWSRNSTR